MNEDWIERLELILSEMEECEDENLVHIIEHLTQGVDELKDI